MDIRPRLYHKTELSGKKVKLCEACRKIDVPGSKRFCESCMKARKREQYNRSILTHPRKKPPVRACAWIDGCTVTVDGHTRFCKEHRRQRDLICEQKRDKARRPTGRRKEEEVKHPRKPKTKESWRLSDYEQWKINRAIDDKFMQLPKLEKSISAERYQELKKKYGGLI